jgi:GNAT superfamily N-acetyltransferase
MNERTTTPEIMRPQPHQTDLVTQILAEAFADDPVSTWISPDTASWLPYYFNILNTHFLLRRGQVYLTNDGSGAALWLPPGRTMRAFPPLRSLELLWKSFFTSGIRSVLRSMIAAIYFDIYHISEPHYYLHVIGVRKNRAGQGIGTSLLQEVLDRCDREGIPAYLENSNFRNMDFYQRCGFRVIRKIRLLSTGPELWLMVRRPLIR